MCELPLSAITITLHYTQLEMNRVFDLIICINPIVHTLARTHAVHMLYTCTHNAPWLLA